MPVLFNHRQVDKGEAVMSRCLQTLGGSPSGFHPAEHCSYFGMTQITDSVIENTPRASCLPGKQHWRSLPVPILHNPFQQKFPHSRVWILQTPTQRPPRVLWVWAGSRGWALLVAGRGLSNQPSSSPTYLVLPSSRCCHSSLSALPLPSILAPLKVLPGDRGDYRTDCRV